MWYEFDNSASVTKTVGGNFDIYEFTDQQYGLEIIRLLAIDLSKEQKFQLAMKLADKINLTDEKAKNIKGGMINE